MVAKMTVAQLKLGAPIALMPTTVAPMRLVGVLQTFAPDWVTALLMSARFMPGDPFHEVRQLRDVKKRK
jgi:hypothetical protein